jgi:hypothetical protein
VVLEKEMEKSGSVLDEQRETAYKVVVFLFNKSRFAMVAILDAQDKACQTEHSLYFKT